jgi:hypothetical protein
MKCFLNYEKNGKPDKEEILGDAFDFLPRETISVFIQSAIHMRNLDKKENKVYISYED